MERCDVAIVGAGLAGLSAARALKHAGLSFVVLEARERVGGRTWTDSFSDGTPVDRGGQWIGPPQTRVVELARQLGVETFPTYDQGETQRYVAGQANVEFDSLVPILIELQTLAETVNAEAPWLTPNAAEFDAITLQTWFDTRAHDALTKSLARLVTTALFTAEPSEISLLHAMFYVKSAGSISALTQVPGGAQEQRFVKGAQELSERLAEDVGRRHLRFASPVRRITQEGGRVLLETDWLRVECARTIAAAPISLLGGIAFRPPLPGYRAQLQQRMCPGVTVKINCLYPSPFWRETGSNGRVLNDDGPISVTFDNSPANGGKGVLVGFAEADEGRRLLQLSPAERRDVVLSSFVRFFGERARQPLDYMETSWSDEEWTRGCFGANFGPGGWTRYGAALREPIGSVHWAGAETSPIWMNYMEGAVRSGERAAAEVITALRAPAARAG
jgi:monoamine oxidase